MDALKRLLSGFESDLQRLFRFSQELFISERVSVIIPAFNEEKTVRRVVSVALATAFVDEVIVVDDGSSDKTGSVVSKMPRVLVVRHDKNLGKGRAIVSGMNAASNDVLLFLDADVSTFSTAKICSLVLPVLNREADLVKASFVRSRGRLTALVAKPLMRLLFPASSFSQPLSGQFCCRKSLLQSLQIEKKWGIDVAILLDAVKQGLHVREVDIGELVHKERSIADLAVTSEQVMGTMLKKAGLTADQFSAVVLSESALVWRNRLRPNVLLVLSRLRKRRYRLLLLGRREVKALERLANDLLLDDFVRIPHNRDSDLLGFFKKVLKKKGLRLSGVAFVSADRMDAELLKNAGISFSVGSDSVVRKAAVRHASAFSDILLLE